MLMVFFFFLPPIHLSQQLSFILISFYLNLQHRAWDKEEAESLNNQHGDLEVLGAVPGAVGSDPKGHSITPQDHLLQVKLFAGNLGTSHAPVSVFHLPHVPGVCDISQSGIPPPLLFCCSSPSDVGALCVLWVCCVFLLVPSRLSLLFCHSGYLVIDQLQLSGAVAGTLQAGGGWKRCAKLLS